MKIQVHIARTGAGTLQAWVIQEGVHSNRNLLAGRSLRDADKAKFLIKNDLFRAFRYICTDLEIDWKETL